MFSQIKLYFAGGVLLALLALGATVYIQHGQKKVLRAELAQALDANKSNDNTIKELRAEISRTSREYERIIADKNQLIDTFQTIDKAKGGVNADQGKETARIEAAGGSGDAVLDLLGRVLPAGPGQGGECKAADPAASGGAPVVSGNVLYCLDEVNAKNLMKDWALCRDWAQEGVRKLTSLQTGSVQ